MSQFEILAEVNDLVIAIASNKVLCYSTETLDGALLVKTPDKEDNYTLVGTSLLDMQEVQDQDGATPTEKYFNYFSKMYDDTLRKHGQINQENWCIDIVCKGSAKDFKSDYYIDLDEEKQKALENMTILGYDDVDDEELLLYDEVLDALFIPNYIHALNMKDISVWFK